MNLIPLIKIWQREENIGFLNYDDKNKNIWKRTPTQLLYIAWELEMEKLEIGDYISFLYSNKIYQRDIFKHNVPKMLNSVF